MHISILAFGSTGDILSFAALGRGLLKAGHQIRFVTFNDFATRSTELGFDHYPIKGDARA